MHFILLAALLPAPSPDFFEMRIRPLLAKNCWSCHTTTRLGNLQLDSRDNLLRGGKTGPAIVPGDPDHSLLIQAVRRTHPTLKMPPTGPLAEADLADLTAWVKNGAPWPDSSPGPRPPAPDQGAGYAERS
jgi:mono/diheme cytochrome c family protein